MRGQTLTCKRSGSLNARTAILARRTQTLTARCGDADAVHTTYEQQYSDTYIGPTPIIVDFIRAAWIGGLVAACSVYVRHKIGDHNQR